MVYFRIAKEAERLYLRILCHNVAFLTKKADTTKNYETKSRSRIGCTISKLDESKIVDSEEVRPGGILDFNEHDEVVGVEILRLSKRVLMSDISKDF